MIARQADKLEALLKRKYRNALAFKSANVIKPMVKIVRLFTQLSDDEIINQLIEQNVWLADRQIEIVRSYRIGINDNQYTNLIIATNLETQSEFLSRQKILFNFKVSKCYAYFNIIQCNRCCAYGHMSGDCAREQVCKFCAQDHPFFECPNKQQLPRCINCTNKNGKIGSNYKTGHMASADVCPIRISRINAIKDSLKKK